jgi:hypothetical protein
MMFSVTALMLVKFFLYNLLGMGAYLLEERRIHEVQG